MRPDRDAWARAGGDLAHLELYAALGRAAPFAEGADRCLATLHPQLPEVGCVGDWVGGDGVRLAAEAWLRAQGCRVARGPLELCAWFEHRASVGPFEEPPFAFEPTDRADRWERSGYAPVARYVSAVADHDRQIAAAVDPVAALSATGWRLEGFAQDAEGRLSEAGFREAVLGFHALASRAFASDPAFAEVPGEALLLWYAPFRRLLDPRLLFLARDPEGQPGGFLLALPDFVRPERRWFLVRSLAVLPEHRQLGIGAWLVAAAHKAAMKAGYEAGVHCMMPVDDGGQVSRHGGQVLRRYLLLEKALA